MLERNIEGYTIKKKIGAGAFSEVYRAVHQKTGKMIAVKVLLNRDDSELSSQFRREYKFGKTFKGKHLPRFHFLKEFEGKLITGMTLLDVPNLRMRIQEEGALPPAALTNLATNLAESFCEVESLGIVHNDLNPANVLFDGKGKLMLVDFAIATRKNILGFWQRAPLIQGTVSYMSPEQIARARLTPKSDMYGLGVTLFEAATGQLPFKATSSAHMLDLQRKAHPPAPSEINKTLSREFDEILLALLEKSPENRPKNFRWLFRHLSGMRFFREGVIVSAGKA